MRRYRKIIDEEKVFAITKFAKDLLEVRDALRYGMETLDADVASKENDLEKLRAYLLQTIEGQRLTAESMDHCLKRFNIE